MNQIEMRLFRGIERSSASERRIEQIKETIRNIENTRMKKGGK